MKKWTSVFFGSRARIKLTGGSDVAYRCWKSEMKEEDDRKKSERLIKKDFSE